MSCITHLQSQCWNLWKILWKSSSTPRKILSQWKLTRKWSWKISSWMKGREYFCSKLLKWASWRKTVQLNPKHSYEISNMLWNLISKPIKAGPITSWNDGNSRWLTSGTIFEELVVKPNWRIPLHGGPTALGFLGNNLSGLRILLLFLLVACSTTSAELVDFTEISILVSYFHKDLFHSTFMLSNP